jgi:hypothetical protein
MRLAPIIQSRFIFTAKYEEAPFMYYLLRAVPGFTNWESCLPRQNITTYERRVRTTANLSKDARILRVGMTVERDIRIRSANQTQRL